jgi:hypothetical protein
MLLVNLIEKLVRKLFGYWACEGEKVAGRVALCVSWWLVAGGWWLVAGGWWLVGG